MGRARAASRQRARPHGRHRDLPARRRHLARPCRRRRLRRQRRGRGRRHQRHPRVGPHRDADPADQLAERRRRVRRHRALDDGRATRWPGSRTPSCRSSANATTASSTTCAACTCSEEHVREALDGAAGRPRGRRLRRGRHRHDAASTSRAASARRRASCRHTDTQFTVGVLALTNFGDRHRLADRRRAGRPRDRRPHAGRAPRGLVHRRPRHRRAAERPPVRAPGQALLAGSGAHRLRTPPTAAARSWSPSARRTACRARPPSSLTARVGRQRPDVRSSSRRAVDATAESVVNSLCAAHTTVGRGRQHRLRAAARTAWSRSCAARARRAACRRRAERDGSPPGRGGRSTIWRARGPVVQSFPTCSASEQGGRRTRRALRIHGRAGASCSADAALLCAAQWRATICTLDATASGQAIADVRRR